MRILFAIMLTVCFGATVFGTGQIPDNIIYKGKKYELLHSYPMDDYFKKHPDKHPRKDFRVSTALARGYLATFEIKENQLYVKDIGIRDGVIEDERGRVVPKFKSVMRDVFPNQTLVKVNWVTGLFVLPIGEMIYDPEVFGKYESYIILELENGIVKREKTLTYQEYEEFKKEQFEAFKQTEEYEKIKAAFLKRRWDEARIDRYVKYQIIEYSKKILVE